MTEDLARLDATAQAALVQDGDASPTEVADAAIERIEAINPEINAVIAPLCQKAREAASGDLSEGPFRGVPSRRRSRGRSGSRRPSRYPPADA